MSTTTLPARPTNDRDLVIARMFAAPRERVYHAWTMQLPQWWGPHGTTTPCWNIDLRPGGIFCTVMRAPNGREYPTRGIFLEVVPNERIVFTDAYGPNWEPSPAFFFTAFTTFEALDDQTTRLTVRALHWSTEARAKHEQMGFHQGWGESLDRLADCVTVV